MTLNETFKIDEVKGVATSKSDFNYDSNHTFFEFTNGLRDVTRL